MGNRRSASTTKGTGRKRTQDKKKRRFGSGVVDFTRGVRGELRRVSWPNRDQLQQSTAVVLIIVLALAAYVALWDFVFQSLAKLIFL
jgi:preprotein translocase subunit SecE